MVTVAEPEVYVRPQVYEVSVWPDDQADSVNAGSWRLTVEYRGNGSWGIFRGGGSLSMDRSGQFSIHSPQDDGHDEWLAAHRFARDEALEIACQWAPKIYLCGMTAAEVLALEAQDA